MSVPMDSILEELRSLDGELFKSELVQRLYLILKTQATESIRNVWDVTKGKQTSTYSKALGFYIQWSPTLRDEEMRRVRAHRGVDELWLQVALLYVKLSHKTPEARTVRIKTPVLEDLLEHFFRKLAKSHFTETGELWSYDAVKLDYAMREIFRHAIICSVVLLESAADVQAPPAPVVKKSKLDADMREADDEEIYPDDSISSFLDTNPARNRFNAQKELMKPRQQSEPEPEPEHKHKHTDSESESESDMDRPPPPETDDRDRHDSRSRSDSESGSDHEHDAATVCRGRGRSDADDGATVYRSSDPSDGATIVRGRDRDMRDSSVISSSTRSSDSSRFSRMQPAKVVNLSRPPKLGTVEEKILVPGNIVEEESDEDESKSRPIVVTFKN